MSKIHQFITDYIQVWERLILMGSYSPGCSGEAIGDHLQDLWKWERSDQTPKGGWWYGVELIMINQYMRAQRISTKHQCKQNFCLRNSCDLSKCWLHTLHTTNLVLPSKNKKRKIIFRCFATGDCRNFQQESESSRSMVQVDNGPTKLHFLLHLK